MTDGILFALGCGIFFIFISGAYVYVRETAAHTAGSNRPVGPTAVNRAG